MKNKVIKLIAIISILTACLSGCKKDWLDAKPDKSLVVPSSIKDYQALLDNVDDNFAVPFNSDQSTLDEFSSNDYTVNDNVYDGRSLQEQAAFIWSSDIFKGAISNILTTEWERPYQRIFNTNIILEGIKKITPISFSEQSQWNNVKGSALFFRAYDHYKISQIFCKPYDKETAISDLGIPLRTQSDINITAVRSTVQQTYDQVLSDLKEAANLVSQQAPTLIANITDAISVTRPNKAAIFAMLARVYLSMSIYDSAFTYADMSLQLYNKLMDFNNAGTSGDVLASGNFRIPRFNKETLFFQKGLSYGYYSSTNIIVDTSLSQLYSNNDLRIPAFHRLLSGQIRYLGSYTNSNSVFFTGLATDEIYLIRAECNARKGSIAAALSDLNTLWQKRWNNASGVFQPYTAIDANDALQKIIMERRKELCFRGLRWSDLRRLNNDPLFAVTLKRTIHGQTYTLTPGSSLYVLPVPVNVVELSGMQQNPR